MPAKKYISKINKGGNDIHIKDTEAHDAIWYFDIYVGAAANSAAIIDETYHHNYITRGRPILISNAENDYLWVIAPASYAPCVMMSGMEVEMSLDSSTTIDDKSYKVWKSDCTYSGTFKVCLIERNETEVTFTIDPSYYYSVWGPIASAPASPEIGQQYFATDMNMLVVWNGTSWVTDGNFIP
jgi:hypothetical protein